MASIAQLIVPADAFGTPDFAIADWAGRKVYLLSSSAATIRGYAAELVTQLPLVSTYLNASHAGVAFCGDVDPVSGAVIVQTNGAGSSNADPIAKFDPFTLAQTGTFGGTGAFPSYPTSVWLGQSLVCVTCNGVNYALLKETAFSGTVAVIRTDTMAHAGAHLTVVSGATNNRGIMCRGASGTAGGSAFLTWEGAVNGQSATIPLYKITILPGAETYDPATWPTTNPHITSATIGTIAAASIDPAWSTLQANAIGYDAADGNVLLNVVTVPGPTNTHYIAKVNAATAAVMWAAPVVTTDVATLASGRINARLSLLRSGSFDAIELDGGDETSITYNGVTPTLVAGDSLRGLMLLHATYTQGTGSPVPAAGTPTSFSNGWAIADWLDPNFPLPVEVREVLLPTAELQFADANGHPYAGGTLELLVPGTATPKDTWIDPDGTALNTNPIVLDAAGRCIVYGDGAYRSILKDALGNLIWDRETTTEVSAAMMPVVGAPTIAEAQRLLGIDDSGLPAEIAAREAADAAETAARIAADANLQSEIDAETAARIAADAALAAIGGPNVRAGTVTTNSSGFARITFATPFPTACQGITVTPSGQHAPTPLTATTNTPDAAGCDVYTGVYSGTTGVAAAATACYYIAVGN